MASNPNKNPSLTHLAEAERKAAAAIQEAEAAAAATRNTASSTDEAWIEDTHPVTGKRVRRKKVGNIRDVLNFTNMDPRYHYHVINDDPERHPDRVQRKLEQGYEFVESDGKDGAHRVEADGEVARPGQMGTRVRRRVGTTKGGEPVYGYLMRIPKQWYEQAKKADEAELKRDEEGLYTPNPANNEFMGSKPT